MACFPGQSGMALKGTRRPASADRTARRQFQATGQPVSRTQASDAMTSWLPRYEAKCIQRWCFQWGSVPLRSDIKGTQLPQPIYWYHSKGNWLRYNFAVEFLYNETFQQTRLRHYKAKCVKTRCLQEGQLAYAANRSICCFNCMSRLCGHNTTNRVRITSVIYVYVHMQ